MLCSHDNQTITVDDICDTNEYETVYNLRIADWHTYFVSDDGWGWSIWAHNVCSDAMSNVSFTTKGENRGGQAHALETLAKYEPGAVFSGLYDMQSGRMLLSPSFDAIRKKAATVKAGEAMPIGEKPHLIEQQLHLQELATADGFGRVNRRGGHGTLLAWMKKVKLIEAEAMNEVVGFAVKIRDDGTLAVAFKSNTINTKNWGSIEAPEIHPTTGLPLRQTVLESVETLSGRSARYAESLDDI